MDLNALSALMNQFVEQKGWYLPDSIHPQTSRSLAISLALEAAEVLEHFQWGEEARSREELASELADVTLYLLQLARLNKIDLEAAVLKKLHQNSTRHWE